MNNPVILCEKVGKTYHDGSLCVEVLHSIDLSIEPAQSVGIMGSSGSGKSTMLHLLGGLDIPDQGEIHLMGKNTRTLSQDALSVLRNQHLGFVYQFHHLLPEFSALENIMMPLLIAGEPQEKARVKALHMLDRVGLKNRAEHRPSELSGGERQRAAIARALVMHPDCVLADEPTGNLDKSNAKTVIDLMIELKQELGTALVVVTHDEGLLRHFDRVLRMNDGMLH